MMAVTGQSLVPRLSQPPTTVHSRSLFDWCVFATDGWQPAAVTAYLLKAAPLFERLA